MDTTGIPTVLLRTSARAFMRLPRPLLGRINPRARGLPPGQRLDEQMAAALTIHERFGPPPLEHTDPTRARVIYARAMAAFQPKPRPMAETRDLVIGARDDGAGIPTRVYRPHGADPGGPAILYFHGGGGVIGSVEVYDPACRVMADDTGYVVIAIDYRLAPEYPFPAAVEDACEAFQWLRAHAAELAIDPDRIAVAGDSMGGNLSAVVSQTMRGAAQPALQVLLYPGLDFTVKQPSHQEFADGYLLTGALMSWFRGHYLPDDSQAHDPRASPLVTEDLSGLPPALIITAGFDPLRDEGRLYAEKLARAGVTVRYRCEHSLIHGFINVLGVIDAARRATERMNRDIRELLRPGEA